MFYRRWLTMFLGAVLCGAIGSLVWACGGYRADDDTQTSVLVQQLGELSRGSLVAQSESNSLNRTVGTLRSRGQAALDATIEYRNRRVTQLGGTEFAEIENLDHIIERIAGQKLAVTSGLFWHASMGEAIATARESNRPILSLRMLGRLDEDLSCANSRFFRAMLYPDPEIGAALRERFVLHWQPVRDVPIVTIDFGSGRRLRKPLTGNSVHLVLDSQGRPFEALPGLVSPGSFKAWLDEVHQFWTNVDRSDEATFWSSVAAYHGERAVRRRSESSLAIAANQQVSELNPLDPRWSQPSGQVPLASNADQAIQLRGPAAEAAMIIAPTKAVVEAPLLRLVQPVRPSIARDTLFNLYALQTKVDDWFAAATAPFEYQDLSKRIYADAFLMPLDDPWLGLSPEDDYAALDNRGRIEPDASLLDKIGFSR